MNRIIVSFFGDTRERDFEKIFGECLESELIRSGLAVELPSCTDWGYVFRITHKKQKFDVIVNRPEKSANTLSISIESTLSRLQRLFSTNDAYEREALVNCIDELLSGNSFSGKQSWPYSTKRDQA